MVDLVIIVTDVLKVAVAVLLSMFGTEFCTDEMTTNKMVVELLVKNNIKLYEREYRRPAYRQTTGKLRVSK
jgi:hypothetical protein